jgi:hypothetical protein
MGTGWRFPFAFMDMPAEDSSSPPPLVAFRYSCLVAPPRTRISSSCVLSGFLSLLPWSSGLEMLQTVNGCPPILSFGA